MLRYRLLLPPWLLLAGAAVGVQQMRQMPLQFSGLAPEFQGALERLTAAQSPGDIPVPLFQILLRTAAAAALWIPIAVLIVGVITVVAPHTRARWVQRHFRITPDQPPGNAAQEIAAFVHRRTPQIALRWNLRRGDLTAVAYPLGYRRAAVAIFGGLLKLWRRDQQAAEAVLLHELAHITSGDAPLVGVGSLFDWLARRWVVVMLVAWLLPILPLVAIGAQAIVVGQPGTAIAVLIQYLGSILILLPVLLLQTVAVLLPLIAALWCAELNADRCAVDALGSAAPVTAALHASRRPLRRRDWLLERMTYPPDRLRRWSASRLLGLPGSLALLLLYPLASIVPFLVLTVAFWLILVPFGASAEFAGAMGTNVTNFLRWTILPLWGTAAALMLVWPALIARRAAALLGGGRLSWPPYLLGAALIGAGALLALLA